MTSQPSFTWRSPNPTRRRIAIGTALAIAALMMLGAFGSLSMHVGDADAKPLTPNQRVSPSRVRDNNIYVRPRPMVSGFFALRQAQCESTSDEDYVPFTWSTYDTSFVNVHADSPYDRTDYEDLPPTTAVQYFRVKCNLARQTFTMTAFSPGGQTKSVAVVSLKFVSSGTR